MGSTRVVVANVLDYDVVISEFGLLSHYCIHFRTNTVEEAPEDEIKPNEISSI